ncbi:PD-(D/E)XK nuclease family protein [Conexibacter sp. SYSU D00693]|uniref:PD-(D/E)XK nuclease family protein n=1 Tax=Conexibacter sp. SYSU D00693 TaxID=2812560 RepID=UPI00196A866E|nr:PD-(D/E)XK nuclease family protein [Conexibacter sp. SYSU D00693]
MPLELVTGPANAAKAGVVLDAMRRDQDRDPILVVPTFADVERYRRELAEGGVVFGAQVLRFAWLTREVGRRAGVRERPLGRLARERAAVAATAAATLDRLAPAAATDGFPAALLRLVAELEQGRIDPPRLTRALRDWAGDDEGRRAYGDEVSALYAGYRRVLERLGRKDDDLAAGAALDALRLAPHTWGSTPVLFYGFDDLEPLQLDAIDTLANHAGAEVTFALTFEAGREATKARARTHADLLALGATERTLPAQDDHYAPHARVALHHVERSLLEPKAKKVAAGGAVRCLAGGGERAEAELVAGHVKRLITREGLAPDDVAIVHRGLRDAAPLLEQVLRAAGVPAAIERPVPAGHTALGRAVVALLRCATGEGTADDLLAWLRAPGLLEVPAFADELEATCRREGARTVAEARAIWEQSRWPLDALDRVAAAAQRGPKELCERLAGEAAALLAAPWRRQARVLDGSEVADAQVAARLRSALRELGGLPPELVPDAAGLAGLLARLDVHLGDPPGPGRVTVATPLQLRARRVRALFCMGLQEGVFPAPGRPEPFLGDEERREVNAASGLRLRLHEDRLAAERHLLYVTVSRPTDLLVLSWHDADDEGKPLARSPFVDDVCDLLRGDLVAKAERRELGEAGWAAGDAPTEHDAARAAAAQRPAVAEAPIPPLRHEPVLQALRDRPSWSASGLEAWAACPVRWLVERQLRPETLVPDPEPLVRGSLAHQVLEDALKALTEAGHGLTPQGLPRARALLREALDEHAEHFRISVNPERLRSALRRLEVDLVACLEHAAHAGSTFTPERFELRFGGHDDPLPALELLDGELRLQGRIDRLDLGPGGTEAIVYDYKGRTAPRPADWGEQGKLQVGLYMLAVEHLLGLRAAGGFYQPLNASAPIARGVLRAGSDPGLRLTRGDRRPDEEVDAVLDACTQAACTAVREIRAGKLEARPHSCGPQGCQYPSICRAEVASQ